MNKLIAIPLVGPCPQLFELVESLNDCIGIDTYTIVVALHGNRSENEMSLLRSIRSIRCVIRDGLTGIDEQHVFAQVCEIGLRFGDFVVLIDPKVRMARDALVLMEYCRERYAGEERVFSVSACSEWDARQDPSHLARRSEFDGKMVGIWSSKWLRIKNAGTLDDPDWHLRLAAIGMWQIYPLRSRITSGTVPVEQAVNAFVEQPFVTAVMVTGMNPKRHSLARVSIKCFLSQTHGNKELLIINHGSCEFLKLPSNVREIHVEKGPKDTIGDLRNLGLRHAFGDFIVNWDDDDWHSSDRISVQMAAQPGDAAVVLRRQIRYNFLNDSAFCENVPHGISGTILHPAKTKHTYKSLIRGSDTAFMSAYKNRIVVNNQGRLYVRFFHGMNLWHAGHIMHHLAKDEVKARRELNEEDEKALDDALVHYDVFRKELGCSL